MHPEDSSERVTGPLQRPLPVDTQQTQGTNIHALGGIAILAIEQPQTARSPGSAALFAEFIYIYVGFYLLVSVQNK